MNNLDAMRVANAARYHEMLNRLLAGNMLTVRPGDVWKLNWFVSTPNPASPNELHEYVVISNTKMFFIGAESTIEVPYPVLCGVAISMGQFEELDRLNDEHPISPAVPYARVFRSTVEDFAPSEVEQALYDFLGVRFAALEPIYGNAADPSVSYHFPVERQIRHFRNGERIEFWAHPPRPQQVLNNVYNEMRGAGHPLTFADAVRDSLNDENIARLVNAVRERAQAAHSFANPTLQILFINSCPDDQRRYTRVTSGGNVRRAHNEPTMRQILRENEVHIPIIVLPDEE